MSVSKKNTYKEQLPFLKKWAEEGTRNNTHLWMQVSYAGRQTPGEINTSPKVSSSVPLRIPGKKFGKPKALTPTEIKEIIKKFTFCCQSVSVNPGLQGCRSTLHTAIFFRSFYHPT